MSGIELDGSEVAQLALRDALNRLGAAIVDIRSSPADAEPHHHHRVAAATTEAAVWVCILDEAAGHAAEGLLSGVRWARNRGIHDLVMASAPEVRPGRAYPRRYPRGYTHLEYRWRQMPRPSQRRASTRWDHYDEHLAGQEVLASLTAAAAIVETGGG